MPYYVVGPDGQKYGPAEPQQLQAWVMEGRITPQTFIEDATSGDRVPAAALPFLTQPGPAAINYPPPAAPAFPPPVAATSALPAANLQNAIAANTLPTRVRRRNPVRAVLRVGAAIFMVNVFIRRMAAGHPIVHHNGSHAYFSNLIDKYPAIDLVIVVLLLFWAWQAWHGTE